ncbi:MAG: MBL fold metallo-hydrolase [Chloroflexota bacterium]
MIKPLLQDNAFLTDIQEKAHQPDQLHIWWLGQSGFLVQWQGNHLLLDPYLSDSLTKKYANTPKPHVRMTERVIEPQKLDFIDVVTSSHNHTDHLDGETLIPLLTANPELTVIVPEANRSFAADRLQVPAGRLTGITINEPQPVDAFTFHALPSAHEELERDEQGHHKFIGLIIQVGPWTLYHSGDTIWYNGLVEYLSNWSIDLAFLPINGRDPKRGVAGNLSGLEAVDLAQKVGIGIVIPCHFEMFEFNTVSPDAFLQAAKSTGQGHCLLRSGEHVGLG